MKGLLLQQACVVNEYIHLTNILTGLHERIGILSLQVFIGELNAQKATSMLSCVHLKLIKGCAASGQTNDIMTRLYRCFAKLLSDPGRNARNKYVHILCVCMLFSVSVKAQREARDNRFTDRLFFGGNLGGIFGTVTFIEVSPMVGYNITDRWQAGTRLSYQYFSDRRVDIHGSLYGASIFSRYFIWQDLFAHVEFEGLNDPWSSSERSIIYNPYIGGGYVARIGSVAGVAFTLLYNLNVNSPTSASNPILNIGFVYGLPR